MQNPQTILLLSCSEESHLYFAVVIWSCLTPVWSLGGSRAQLFIMAYTCFTLRLPLGVSRASFITFCWIALLSYILLVTRWQHRACFSTLPYPQADTWWQQSSILYISHLNCTCSIQCKWLLLGVIYKRSKMEVLPSATNQILDLIFLPKLTAGIWYSIAVFCFTVNEQEENIHDGAT